MKPRPAHLRVSRVGAHEWGVYVIVADGRWQIATTGTASEALAIAAQKIAERQVNGQEVSS